MCHENILLWIQGRFTAIGFYKMIPRTGLMAWNLAQASKTMNLAKISKSCNEFSDIESCSGFYVMEPCKGFYGMWKQTTFDSNFPWQFLAYYDSRFANINISINFYSKLNLFWFFFVHFLDDCFDPLQANSNARVNEY